MLGLNFLKFIDNILPYSIICENQFSIWVTIYFYRFIEKIPFAVIFSSNNEYTIEIYFDNFSEDIEHDFLFTSKIYRSEIHFELVKSEFAIN